MKRIQLDKYDKKRLSEYQRRKQLFVHLANTLSLKVLGKREKRAFVREAERAGVTAKAFSVFGAHRLIPAEARQVWGMQSPAPFAWGAVVEIHPWVRQLPALLAGGSLRLPVAPPVAPYRLYKTDRGLLTELLGDGLRVRSWWSKDGVHNFVSSRAPRDALLEDFAATLNEHPLPYRCCAQCPALFVVVARRGKPQQYCSPRCANQASEARRDPDKRRADQRELMRDRRASGKEPKRLQTKARIPVVKSRGTCQGRREKS